MIYLGTLRFVRKIVESLKDGSKEYQEISTFIHFERWAVDRISADLITSGFYRERTTSGQYKRTGVETEQISNSGQLYRYYLKYIFPYIGKLRKVSSKQLSPFDFLAGKV